LDEINKFIPAGQLFL